MHEVVRRCLVRYHVRTHAAANELRQDPIFFRTNGGRLGRDGCRVPIPWAPDPPGFGFTTGTPWLPIPASWGEKSAAAQAGAPGSFLELYRAALALRPREGAFAWVESPAGTLSFERGELTCLVNLSAEPVPLPAGKLLLASDAPDGTSLTPDTAAWLGSQ